jgi:hypothetical protein
METFEQFRHLTADTIYNELNKAWKVASIDKTVTCKEAFLVPVFGDHAVIGAAIFISILAYSDDEAKRERFVSAVAAHAIKTGSRPKSTERKELRTDDQYNWAIDVPNKRIQQSFADCGRRISIRLRAANVLALKLTSDGDPDKQAPLNKFILRAAQYNTPSYPAFYSTESDPIDQEERISDSFRRQVMYSSAAVYHLALAFYLRFETATPSKLDLFKTIMSAQTWFKETMVAAEVYRVMFGDMFPRHDSQYKANRVQNVSSPLEETISILPFADPIEEHMDFKWFLNNKFTFPKA